MLDDKVTSMAAKALSMRERDGARANILTRGGGGSNREIVVDDREMSTAIGRHRRRCRSCEGTRGACDARTGEEEKRGRKSRESASPNSRLPYINEVGNLELSMSSDVPLFQDFYNPFGSIVAAFTRSKIDEVVLTNLDPENFINLLHNQNLCVNRAAVCLGAALRKSNKENLELLRINEYALFGNQETSDNLKVFEVKVENLEEQVKHMTADKTLSDHEHISEITVLTAALASIEECADLKEQQSKQVVSSNSLHTDELYEAAKATKNYADDMVSFLEQGFDKFRRSALRHVTDPSFRDLLQGIDFDEANEEDQAEFLQ